jgi:hypothetical protein
MDRRMDWMSLCQPHIWAIVRTNSESDNWEYERAYNEGSYCIALRQCWCLSCLGPRVERRTAVCLLSSVCVCVCVCWGTLPLSYIVQRAVVRWLMGSELTGVWKEAVMAYFKLLSWETEKNYEIPRLG